MPTGGASGAADHLQERRPDKAMPTGGASGAAGDGVSVTDVCSSFLAQMMEFVSSQKPGNTESGSKKKILRCQSPPPKQRKSNM